MEMKELQGRRKFKDAKAYGQSGLIGGATTRRKPTTKMYFELAFEIEGAAHVPRCRRWDGHRFLS